MAAFFLLKKGFEEYKVIKQSENAISYPRFNLLVLCCRVLCPVASIVISSLRPRTVAHQAPQSRGFYRQIYWNGLLCPLPGFFPTRESNPSLQHLLHCRQIRYFLSHLGSPIYQGRCNYLELKIKIKFSLRVQYHLLIYNSYHIFFTGNYVLNYKKRDYNIEYTSYHRTHLALGNQQKLND